MTEGAINFLAKLGITKGRTTPARDNIESYNIDELIDLVTSHPCFQEIYMPIIQAKLDAGKKMLKDNTVHPREANTHKQKPGFYITSSKLISNSAEPFYNKGPTHLNIWWKKKLEYMKSNNITSINNLPLSAGDELVNYDDKTISPDFDWTLADIMRYVIVNCITHILNSYIKYGIKDKHKLRAAAVDLLKKTEKGNFGYYDDTFLRAYLKDDYDTETSKFPETTRNHDLYKEELKKVTNFLDSAYELINNRSQKVYADILDVVIAYADWDDERMKDQIMVYNYGYSSYSFPRLNGKKRVTEFFSKLKEKYEKYNTINVFFYLPMTTAPNYKKTMYLYTIPVIFFSIVNEIGHETAFNAYSNIYHDMQHKERYVEVMKEVARIQKYKPTYNRAILSRKNSKHRFSIQTRKINNISGTRSVNNRIKNRRTNKDDKFNKFNIYDIQRDIYERCVAALNYFDNVGDSVNDVYYLIFSIVHENVIQSILKTVICNRKRDLDNKFYNIFFQNKVAALLDESPELKDQVITIFNNCKKIGLSYLLYGSRLIKILMLPDFRRIITTASAETHERFKSKWPKPNTMIGNFTHVEFFEIGKYFELIDIIHAGFEQAGFYNTDLDNYINAYNIEKYVDPCYSPYTKKSGTSRTPK